VACTTHSSPDLSHKAYRDIFVSSTAELPGLLVAAFTVGRASPMYYFSWHFRPLGPSKGRYDPRVYQLTDCKNTLGFRVKVLRYYFHEATPLIPP